MSSHPQEPKHRTSAKQKSDHPPPSAAEPYNANQDKHSTALGEKRNMHTPGSVSFVEAFGTTRREHVLAADGSLEIHGVASNALSKDGGGGGGGHQRVSVLGDARFTRRFVRWLHTVFLPEGYPKSVGDDYVAYQTYDVAQALCSAVTGTLSTRAVLAGVGVGSGTADVVSGTLQWIIRDGTGMVGRIFFASRIASDLDNDMKRWRIAADTCNDIGIMLEIGCSMAPPSYFVPLVCTAAIVKAVTAVAGQATRSTMAQHFARRDNMADISAKNASQETAVSFIGMFVGMAVAAFVPPTVFYNTLVFVIVTIIHITLNLRAVRALVLHHFNQARLDIAVALFVCHDEGSSTEAAARLEEHFPTPEVMRHLEGIVVQNPFADSMPKPAGTVDLGANLSGFATGLPRGLRAELLHLVLKDLRAQRFAVVVSGAATATSKRRYHVLLTEAATSLDIMRAYVLVQLSPSTAVHPLPGEGHIGVLEITRRTLERHDRFMALANAKGWVLDRALFKLREWRVEA